MKIEIWIKVVLFSVVLCIAPFAVTSAQEAQPSPDDFGGKFSLGPAIGGGGTVGLPLRYYITQKAILELGPYWTTITDFDLNDLNDSTAGINIVGINIMVAGGFVYYFDKKYIDYKKKCINNGIFIKGGYSFGTMPDYFVAAGWARERFRLEKQRRSFNFELGAGYLGSSDYDPPSPIMIYLKLSLTWFVGSTWK